MEFYAKATDKEENFSEKNVLVFQLINCYSQMVKMDINSGEVGYLFFSFVRPDDREIINIDRNLLVFSTYNHNIHVTINTDT